MAIYQPQAHEIMPLMQRARDAWPHMACAIDKAEQIVLTGGITANAGCFIVDSQSDAAYTYQVYTDQHTRRCGCPSYNTGGYVASGRTFCKHLIAVSAYVEILRAQLKARIYGDSNDRATRQKLQAHRFTYLMRISGTRTVSNITSPRLFFQTTWGKDNRLAFVSNFDAIRFATWLHGAPPGPDPLPFELDRYDQEIAKQQAAAEWQVELTPEQLKRWYATGSIV